MYIDTISRLVFADACEKLDEISIDNLRCGRITKEAMHWAIGIVLRDDKHALSDYHWSKEFANTTDMKLADVLNDLLCCAMHEGDKYDG